MKVLRNHSKWLFCYSEFHVFGNILIGRDYCTIGIVFNNGPRARKALRQDSRAPGPLLNTTPIVLGVKQAI